MTKRRNRVSKLATATFAFALLFLVAVPALAQTAGSPSKKGPSFDLKVIVANLTDSHKKIDEGARRLDKELKSQFRYEGIRVLDTVNVTLTGDEVWDHKLPSRRRLRIRPLVVKEGSALISVEISGLVQSDLKVKEGQLVIIGAERFGDGKLVIAIDASR